MRRNLIKLALCYFNEISKVSCILYLKVLNSSLLPFFFCIFFKDRIKVALDFFPFIKFFRPAFLYDSTLCKYSCRIVVDGIFNEGSNFFCI